MKKLTVALAMAGLLGAGSLSAQTATANATASITIPTLISIGVTNATVGFGAATVTNWNDGYIDANSGTSVISTRANIVHRVTISAASGVTEISGPVAKALTDFQWRTDAGTFAGLSTGPVDVVTGLGRGNNASAATVHYRMLLNDQTDEPGTYSVNFVYTALAN